MNNIKLSNVVFHHAIIDVFNTHLDIYSVFLLSKTSKISLLTYKVSRDKVLLHRLKTSDRQGIDALIRAISAVKIPSHYPYSHRKYFGHLMLQILYSTLDKSEYDLDCLGRNIHDYRSSIFFCAYGKSLDYFSDHKQETYETELDIFYSILEMLRIIRAFDTIIELLSTFLISDHVTHLIANPLLFGKWNMCALFNHTICFVMDETTERDKLKLLVSAYEEYTGELYTDDMY